jgi:hypothetical protein
MPPCDRYSVTVRHRPLTSESLPIGFLAAKPAHQPAVVRLNGRTRAARARRTIGGEHRRSTGVRGHLVGDKHRQVVGVSELVQLAQVLRARKHTPYQQHPSHSAPRGWPHPDASLDNAHGSSRRPASAAATDLHHSPEERAGRRHSKGDLEGLRVIPCLAEHLLSDRQFAAFLIIHTEQRLRATCAAVISARIDIDRRAAHCGGVDDDQPELVLGQQRRGLLQDLQLLLAREDTHVGEVIQHLQAKRRHTSVKLRQTHCTCAAAHRRWI